MRAKGDEAERKATQYLQKRGFVIIDRNFHSRFGEIDIVALKEGTLHFVEVKSGKNFDPIYNITPAKLEKIIKTINYFLLKKKLDMDYCIDAIIIKSDIEFIENITL
jgi:putative endonuclease